MSHDIGCWKCGVPLAELSLPFGRRECCRACGAELHVCRLCKDYDTRVAHHCREPTAEEVRDKESANFCDHYAPRAGAYQPTETSAAESARAELEKLFGGK
jgi:ribosome-binding protein aMBF1 (putative translation factor)